MKTLLKIILLILFVSCKAQTLTPLYNDGTSPNDGIHPNRYSKDVDNDFGPYVGTWKSEIGNTSLTIIFNKVINDDFGNGDYFDLLVGEYKYVENGVTLVNSFPTLMQDGTDGVPNIVHPDDPWLSNLGSIGIKTDTRGAPPCPECPANVRYINLGVSDPTRTNIHGGAKMVRFVENGVEKIRIRIYTTFVDNYTVDYSGPVKLNIPDNSIWTLTKVP
jgi:hypothetical protein